MQHQTPLAPKSFRTPAFEAHLAAIRSKKASALAHIGDVTNGAILVHERGARWVFLLPDMTVEGRWRMQRFDERGFSGHGIFDTQQELVEAAVGEGFNTLDPDALDRLQNTPAFQRGNYLTDLVRRVNSKEITMDDANRLIEAYDAQAH
jgi:hypothetical protein